MQTNYIHLGVRKALTSANNASLSKVQQTTWQYPAAFSLIHNLRSLVVHQRLQYQSTKTEWQIEVLRY